MDAVRQVATEVAQLLKNAKRVLFITGAGISADSGLPTYRGLGGLYEGAKLTHEGFTIEEALSGEMLLRHPEVTWKYLLQIEHTCRDAKPNAAHRAIARLEKTLPEVLTYTQNIDGLHRAAGSRKLIEIHGRIHEVRCTRCRHHMEVPSYDNLPIPPHCPRCHSPMRPNVVLFGESLPGEALMRLENALMEGFDLVFSIGTSSVFPYIVEPVLWARHQGIPTVEINPGETKLSPIVSHRLETGAAAAMTAVLEALEPAQG